MERLNDIIRGTQSSHAIARQRLSRPAPAQGQRTRALPEQTGRLSRGSEVYRAPSPARVRAPLPPSLTGEEDEEDTLSPLTRRLSRTHYGNDSQYTPRTSTPPPYRRLTRGDYYAQDERATVIPADVREEWDDDTDDTAGMGYGDWENAPGYYRPPAPAPAPAPHPPDRELSEVAQRLVQQHNKQNPLVTRELQRLAPEHPHLTGAREGRLPIPATNPALEQQSRAPRTTQPLKSRQVARLRTEIQAVARQAVVPSPPRETGADYTITVQGAAGVCPICKGTGYLRSNVPFGHPQFGKAIACQCKEQERKRKRRQQLQELSNLGAFADKRFSTFNSRVPGLQEAFRVTTEFARAPSGWLLLVGPTGCGKTHLAAAIANECLEAGAVVLFATVPDLLDHLRAAFAPESAEVFDQLFARMREAEVLVLDDLGVQQSSPWANEKLFQLLNYRYNSGFPTVITANPKGLQVTDERIRSRLSDVGLVTLVNMDRARDYRPHNPHRG